MAKFEHRGIMITVDNITGKFGATVRVGVKPPQYIEAASLDAIKKRIDKTLGMDGVKVIYAYSRFTNPKVYEVVNRRRGKLITTDPNTQIHDWEPIYEYSAELVQELEILSDEWDAVRTAWNKRWDEAIAGKALDHVDIFSVKKNANIPTAE